MCTRFFNVYSVPIIIWLYFFKEFLFLCCCFFFTFCCCVVLKVSKATFFKYCLAVFCLWTNDFEQWAVVGRHNTRRKPTLTSCQHENWKLKAKNVARKKHEYEHTKTQEKRRKSSAKLPNVSPDTIWRTFEYKYKRMVYTYRYT